ncbi:MAG: WYL domain-containing protein [Rhodoferax sp.]|nr:WYL domain-containing protein [Rhodoferax sp.]
MNRIERFYKIDQMLHARSVVSLDAFLTELEVSRATFKRDMEYLRERLHAPIVWDRSARGYRLDGGHALGPVYELPGLWFSASELYALLTAHKLLADIEPGVLALHLAPLQNRLLKLLTATGHPVEEVSQRVRLLSMSKRTLEPRHFADVARALLVRKRLQVVAWSRGRDEVNTRVISPQRLVHYRDNWYLDAWCHWRKGLRSFAVDALQQVQMLDVNARDVAVATLDAHHASAYGIFSGAVIAWAVLLFSQTSARWVKSENWHPDQTAEMLPDGRYRLRVPYSDERELLMDILRHGCQVEVEQPPALRQRVADEAAALVNSYKITSPTAN